MNEQIQELLSSYIDGEVTASERQQVEQALAESAELRHELASLRQTVQWLAALPAVAAPRPFTLSEADVPTRQKSGYFSWLMGWSRWGLVGAPLLVIIFMGLLWWQQVYFYPTQLAMAPAPIAELPQAKIMAVPTQEAIKEEAKKEAVTEQVPTDTVAIAESAADAPPPMAQKREMAVGLAAQPAEPPASSGGAMPLAEIPPINMAEPISPATVAVLAIPLITATASLTNGGCGDTVNNQGEAIQACKIIEPPPPTAPPTPRPANWTILFVAVIIILLLIGVKLRYKS